MHDEARPLPPTGAPGSSAGGPDRAGDVWSPDLPATPPLYEPPWVGFGSPGPEPIDFQPVEDPIPSAGTGWRSALLGGLAGAAVATLLTALVFWAVDDGNTLTAVGPPESRPALTLAEEGLDIQALLTKAQPSVVTIETDHESFRGLFGGAGSGLIISEDGLVLTNAHVIAGADTITVSLFDGTPLEASLVGSNPDDDVALIRIEGGSGLVPAELGSSSELLVGDEVVAIGNALNLGGTPSVTLGIVSATDRTIEAPDITLSNLIQTDAAINPGNSGGPLLNARGEVVGINTAIIEEAQNIGFALSIDALRPLIDDISSGQATISGQTTFLGVKSSVVAELTPDEADRYGLVAEEGAVVVSVVAGSAAEAAGLLEGDVIVEIDGRAVTSPDDVAAVVAGLEPGDQVDIEYERDGRRQRAVAELTTRDEVTD